MFNSSEWSNLSLDTFNYRQSIFINKKDKIYLTHVSNEIGDFITSPSFGDFIDVSNFDKNTLNLFHQMNLKKNYKLKIFSRNKLDIKNLPSNKKGFVHEIKFKNYNNWFKEIIKSKFRNQINQSFDNNLNFKVEADYKSMQNFYELHKNLRIKKFNQIPQPLNFFKNLYHQYFENNKGFCFSAYSNDICIASIVCIIENKVAYYKYAASNLEFTNLRPNNFLLDRLIFYLDTINIKVLNLGFTGLSSIYDGLRNYKLKAGSKEYNLFLVKNFTPKKSEEIFVNNIRNDIKNFLSKSFNDKDIDSVSNKYYKYFI